MNKGMFSGWRDVFLFTLRQATGKKFRSVTIGLALVMLAAGVAVSTIMAFVQKKEDGKLSPIGQVYVADNSELDVLYLEGFGERYGETFPDISFVEAQQPVEELAVTLGEQEPESVILEIGRSAEGYLLTVVLPYGSEIDKEDAEDLCEAFASVMEQSKLLSSGIPMEKLVLAMSGVQSSQLDAGEEERSIGEQMVAMLAPMLIIFFMYFMTLMYGMSVGNAVSVEKCSKLMEMMLTLTRPYGLIFGKVLAITVTAISQILLWIGCLVGGFFLGHGIAGAVIYPDYHNVLLEIFILLKGQVGSTAFTPGAMTLAVFTLCGFPVLLHVGGAYRLLCQQGGGTGPSHELLPACHDCRVLWLLYASPAGEGLDQHNPADRTAHQRLYAAGRYPGGQCDDAGRTAFCGGTDGVYRCFSGTYRPDLPEPIVLPRQESEGAAAPEGERSVG